DRRDTAEEKVAARPAADVVPHFAEGSDDDIRPAALHVAALSAAVQAGGGGGPPGREPVTGGPGPDLGDPPGGATRPRAARDEPRTAVVVEGERRRHHAREAGSRLRPPVPAAVHLLAHV